MSDSIGIVGFGFVGQAVYANAKHPQGIRVYDKYKKGLNTFEEVVSHSQLLFCCLPTPEVEDGEQDFSAYAEFFSMLEKTDFDRILVIKSTVLYGNIEGYLDRFNIVMNPEFLNANTAVSDFYNQKLIVLGGRADHSARVAKAYQESFNLSYEVPFEFCSYKEAVDIKYFHNIYHAYKVLFWNFCQEISGNQRKVFSAYSRITGNTNEMQRVAADGKMGYGGACFPKDVNAFNHWHGHELTKFMRKYNGRLRK